MRIIRIASALVAATAAVSLVGCASNETAAPAATQTATGATSTAALSGTLAGKGATSVKAAQEAWTAAFQTANSGVTVNYSPEGSGAGISAFTAGAVGFAFSDVALSDEQEAATFTGCAPDSKALNLPLYISPIAVIFNVEGVDSLTLDEPTLAGIFAGRTTTWNDPAIAATNSGVTLPDAPIAVVHRADESGTTANFTDTMHTLAPDVWTWESDKVWPADLSGETATGTSGVVDAVTNGKNIIGYADASAAKDLGHADLLVGDKPLAPTADAAAAIVDKSPAVTGRGEHDLALALDRKATGVYPAVLVSYGIVCESYTDAAQAALVKAYFGYLGSDKGQQDAAASAGSAPLSSAMLAKVTAAVDSIK